MENSIDKAKSSSAFNMAISTLERLSKILDDIKIVSVQTPIDQNKSGTGQHIKIEYVKQFYIQAVPLLKEPDEKSLKPKLDKIQPQYWKKTNPYDNHVEYISKYNYKIECMLNNLLIEIQNCLQRDGFFMPPKDDPRFAFGK